MRANLACLAAIAVLLAACGAGGVTPGAEQSRHAGDRDPFGTAGDPAPCRDLAGSDRRGSVEDAHHGTGGHNRAVGRSHPAGHPRAHPSAGDAAVGARREHRAGRPRQRALDAWGTSNVLLANGDVLLVNGDGREAAIRDAGSGAWRIVTGLPAVRTGFGFVALGDGSALAVGGVNGDGVSFSSVYRFDPVETTWRKIGLLKWARSYPGVALLPDGRVLVAGGSFLNGEACRRLERRPGRLPRGQPGRRRARRHGRAGTPVTVPYATVEIFDPATGTSTMARPMACARGGPGVATLADGRIMVTDLVEPGCGAAEIYDPATGSFTKTGDLPPLDLKALERLGVDTRLRWDSDSHFEFESLDGPFAMGDGGALLGLGQSEKRFASLHRSFRFRPATNSWAQFGPTAATDWPEEIERVCTKSYSLSSATLVPLADGRVFVVGGSIPPARRSMAGATS